MRKLFNLLTLVLLGAGYAAIPSYADESEYDVLNKALSSLKFDGQVHASNQANVANSVNGLITAIHFEPGDYVNQGQLLIELGSAASVHKVEISKAAVMRRKIELDSARANAERISSLGTSGSASAANEKEAADRLALAKVTLAEAKAHLALAQLEVTGTKIRAPISGFISASRYNLGTYLKTETGQALAKITQIDPALISYKVPYENLLELYQSSPDGLAVLFDRFEMIVLLPNGERLPIVGSPKYNGTELGTDNTLLVWGEVANPAPVLIPGLPVQIRIQLRDQQTANKQ
jgi:RND family efflux transporter MFP subunit